MAKPIYQAIVGLSFDGLKPPMRVESGNAIPDKVPASDINWLLEQKLIREVPTVESEESE